MSPRTHGLLRSALVGPLALLWGAGTVLGDSAYRVLPIGDSITVGDTDNPTWNVPFQFGYRSGLYTRLNNDFNAGTGIPFQFVGNSAEPFNGASGVPKSVAGPDLRTVNQDHHEGYSGVTTSFVNSNISSFLSADNPDIVLLMIGINDIGNGSTANPTAAEANLNNIVQTVVNNKPNARLIVAQITPYSSYTPAIVSYNSYIRDTLIPSYVAQNKHVSTVDQYSNFGTGTTVDSSLYSNGINHPNATGYDKMAQTWYAGIQALSLPLTPPVQITPTNLVTNGGFDTPVYGNNSHNVNPTLASTGWTFTQGANTGAGSGIDHGDAYGAGNSTSVDGAQQACLQSSGNSTVMSISQTITGMTVGQKYQLSFQSKAIQGVQGANPFQVDMLDGTTSTHLFSGADIVPVTTNYTLYTSESFTATNTSMTLHFFDHALNTVQKVSWIDAVSLTAVPEPFGAPLILLGAAGLLARRSRRRSPGLFEPSL